MHTSTSSPEKNSSLDFKNISCRFCKSTKIIKRGKRKTNRGLIQRYFCKDCKKRFTLDDGFFRMRNSPNKITKCLDMYFRGISLRKIQEHLQTFEEQNCSYVSILKWIRKYCTLIGKYTDSLKLETSKQIQIDEMEYRTNSNNNFELNPFNK